ncbi:MAG: hypothetical protein GY710_09360 [Desulfobacteraceae bacterium]|nr:hypothetical protein [Desulfobacteraceae bacterium]
MGGEEINILVLFFVILLIGKELVSVYWKKDKQLRLLIEIRDLLKKDLVDKKSVVDRSE